jgi:hypothetical protein
MTGIEIIGPKLRRAREERKKSLDDIAFATKIDRKFLEDIEAGTTPAMPASYVTAFVKAFAREVDLDPSEWEQAQSATVPADERSEKMFEGQTGYSRPPAPGGTTQQGKILFALASGIVAALLGLFILIRPSDVGSSAEELPFADVIKEHEARYAGTVLPFVSDTASSWKRANADSLVLDALATDTVWVRLVIDGGWMREYAMLPGSRQRWKGRESFVLSLGDGGVVAFALNGRNLGILGKLARPLWNARIDHATAPKQSKQGGPG